MLALNACSLNKAGYNLGQGLAQSTEGIGKNITKEITDEISSDSTQQKLKVLTDGILTNLKENLNQQTLGAIRTDTLGLNLIKGIQNGLADSILLVTIEKLIQRTASNGTTALNELIEETTSETNQKKLAAFLAGIITESLNNKVKIQLNGLTTGLLDSLLSDAGADRIRTQLLGESTKAALNSMLDSAMTVVIKRINQDLSLPQVGQQLNFIQKWAKELLLLMGLIGIGIIAFVWYKRTRYLKLVQLLTNQIDQIPSESAYDELTQRIQKIARAQDYESTIRQVLKDNGMLGDKDWRQYKKKVKQK